MKRTLNCLSLSLVLSLTAPSARAEIGQWDFNSSNLTATAGANLGAIEYYDGPGGATETGTVFGTTTAFGIPNINGTPATVMAFPACNPSMGYNMPTPTVANGTNAPIFVNSWSLVMDLLYTGSSASAWRGLIQIDASGDADLFANPSGGIGITSQYSGQLLSNTWHRVGFTFDLTNAVLNKYIDGTLVGSQAYTGQDGRFALSTGGFAVLFTDDDNETAAGYVNSIQLRDTVLSVGQMAALGGPSAAGIPTTITVVPSTITSRFPASGAVNAPPLPTIVVVINDGTTTLNTSSVKLSLDGVDLATGVSVVGDVNTVTATVTNVLAKLSTHTASVRFADNVNGSQTNTWTFTVANYQDITLPTPIYLETFDGLAEGALPVGWSVANSTDSITHGLNLADFTSDSYLNWVVITSNRLATGGANYVTSVPILVNGATYNLISNNVIHANSDKRGGNQVQYLFTADYNLTGRTNVHLVYNSIFRQNADSSASVEYSIDGGANWLPLLYLIENSDVIRNPDFSVDAETTLNTARVDQALGSSYGSFIGAPVTAALAPYIRAMPTDDLSGKRVEMFRCPAADGQAAVRFRFAQTGTGSWYFGMDNFGLYSLTTPPTIVSVSPATRADAVGMTGTGPYFSVTASGPEPFSYQWYRNGALLPGKTVSQLGLSNGQLTNAGNYTVVVSNGNGSVTSSPPVTVTVGSSTPSITGQWDFNQGDLSADYGQALAYSSAQVQAATTFNTTTAFGIGDIAGQPAKVLRWVPTTGFGGGYVMTHSIAPNGGGAKVNQYTVIIDLMYPITSGFKSLWQTGAPGDADGDVFLNGGGMGISSVYGGALTANEWHRVVFSLDLTQRELGKYIDGVNVVTGQVGATPFGPHEAQYLSAATTALAGGGVDLRWSLNSTAQLLGDDGNEVKEVYVSSVQIRNGRMSDAAIAAMGAPTAGKIPGLIKATSSGGNVVIDWTGSVLESAPSLTGPWTVVPGAAHPHTVVAPTGNVYFKAAQQ
ncbi:MAG: hypothetical protein HOP33_15930 [Verrucomicrobia bacterium]|nr:hypothetical protein [Verrucomicrobiota bacterium]